MANETPPNHTDDELPGQPRRADPRHTLRRAVRLRCAQWDNYIKLYTSNISRGGMLLRVKEPPEVGAPVQINLELPDGDELLLSGKVARQVQPKKEGQMPGIGVALELSDQQRSQLDHYLVMAKSSGHTAPVAPPPGEREPTPPPQQQPEPADAAPTPVPTVKRTAILGIDFGTSSSSVAVARGRVITLFEDESGHSIIPSVVWFRDRGDPVVGQEARDQMAIDPTRTIHSIKRLLGTPIDSPEAAPFLMSLACPGLAGPNQSILFEINGEQLSPIQIAAIIMKRLRQLAEDQLGEKADRAVLACPVSFNEAQREALRRAAKIAGLEVAALIPEPAAAAMAYDRGVERDETVGIYDFGGGTFDFCVLKIQDGSFRIISASGDPWLGGDDLDQALAKAVADEFWRATKVDLRKKVVEWQRVVQACEEAKCYLSLSEEIDVYVPNVGTTAEGPLELSVPVTRDRFEELTGELIDQTISVCEQALSEAKISLSDLDGLLLIGGSSRVPAIRKAVRMIFRREPVEVLHPEQAVVAGTAIKAAELAGAPVHRGAWRSLDMQQVSGRTVGIAMAGGVTEPVISRATPLPAVVRRVFATHRDGQTDLNILVIEGDSRQTRDNQVVGRFGISGLPPRPAGSVEVEVVFEMNEAGALNITARDLASGQRTKGHFELKS